MSENIEEMLGLLEWSDKIIIFVGAGMSAELGIPAYWSGSSAQYGDASSEYGFTALEHASAAMWENNFEEQSLYTYESSLEMSKMVDRRLAGSVYNQLLDYLNADETDFFVVTSNVDSAFKKAGFPGDRIYELHGANRNSQCLVAPKEHGVFKTDLSRFNTPCPSCDSPSRPNTLMFDDVSFNSDLLESQAAAYREFRESLTSESVILEIGVGVTIPRIREAANKIYYQWNIPYLHVNPIKEELNSVWNLLEKKPTAKEFWLKETASSAFKLLNIS